MIQFQCINLCKYHRVWDDPPPTHTHTYGHIVAAKI